MCLAFLQLGAAGEEVCGTTVRRGGSRGGRVGGCGGGLLEAGEDELALFDLGLVGGAFGGDLGAAESGSRGVEVFS